jgi:serine/threonine-protein kinase
MRLRERLATLLRIFLLLTVLVAVGLVSAITTIRLAIRGRQETMPNLVGVQVEAAERIANMRGLELKVEDKVFSTQYAANEIVSQMPPQGTRLKVGQHIHVMVSLGAPRVPVPNLVGDSLRVARIKAIQRGLSVGDVAAVHLPEADPDKVLVQDPAPSTAEVHSPALNLLISLGKPPASFLCPNFVGRPITEVRHALERAGFRVESITPMPTDTTPQGTILTQSPLPGNKIGPDTIFAFQVAK